VKKRIKAKDQSASSTKAAAAAEGEAAQGPLEHAASAFSVQSQPAQAKKNSLKFAVPWWLLFVLGCYGLFKLKLVYESPCAVLGTPSPVTESAVRKAYRKVTMCTHPDKISAIAGGDPQAIRRGEILFTRATQARDSLVAAFSETKLKEMQCYSADLEVQIVAALGEIFFAAAGTSFTEYASMVWDFVYGLITLEAGFMNTLSTFLFLTMIFGILKSGLRSLLQTGLVGSILGICSAFVLGPIPTFFRFFTVPFVRWYIFFTLDLPQGLETVTQKVHLATRRGAETEAVAAIDPQKEAQEELTHITQATASDGTQWAYRIRNLCLNCGIESDQKKFICSKCNVTNWCSQTCMKNNAKAHKQADCANYAKAYADCKQGIEANCREVGQPVENGAIEAEKLGRAAVERAFETAMLIKQYTEELIQSGKSQEEATEQASRMAVAESDKKLKEQGPGVAHVIAVAHGGSNVVVPPFPGTAADGTSGSLYDILARRTKNGSNKMRLNGAMQTKFEFLLTLTKPIIPLAMLLITGDVYSGLIPALIIGQTIRDVVPPISAEAMHLVVLLAGALHTIIGVSEGQVQAYAEQNSAAVPLIWEYDYRDVVALANIAILGAAFSCYACHGNEPQFICTFGAGVSMRLLAADLMPAGVSASLTGLLYSFKLVLANAEGVATRCGGGVGDCAGGPFRMLFGSYSLETVQWGTLGFRFLLMLLPLLYTAQWALRTLIALRKTVRPNHRRIGQCFCLMLGGMVLCWVLATLPLNGVNGSLSNFIVAIAVAALWESLLATYEVVKVVYTNAGTIEKEGVMLQVIFLVIFILL